MDSNSLRGSHKPGLQEGGGRYPISHYTSNVIATVAVWKYIGKFVMEGNGPHMYFYRGPKSSQNSFIYQILSSILCFLYLIKYLTWLYEDGVFYSFADFGQEFGLPPFSVLLLAVETHLRYPIW